MKAINLTGQTFGRLTVVAAAPEPEKRSRWLCECACGGQRVVSGDHLRSGRTSSCGCLLAETRSANGRKRVIHGHSASLTHRSWRAMIQRTTNPRCERWDRYGGRGITVCARWTDGEGGASGFQCFLADMGERPAGLSIEREDNDGNYEPGNCCWADRETQARNTSVSRVGIGKADEARAALAAGARRKVVAAELGLPAKTVSRLDRQRQGHRPT